MSKFTAAVCGLGVIFFVFRPGFVKALTLTPTPNNLNKVGLTVRVKTPTQTSYSDGLEVNNHLFANNETVMYQVEVINNSEGDVQNIKVTQNLGNKLRPILYQGTYNQSSNTLNWTINNLKKGEIKDYNIRASVRNIGSSNSNYKIETTVTTEYGGTLLSDSTFIYAGRVTTPVTGSEDLLIKTGIVLAGLGLVWLIRKAIRGY